MVGFTTKSLQALLLRIGSPTAGRKDSLVHRLSRDLCKSLLPQHGKQKKLRIVSIDMGIKNLAYCVADIQPAELASKVPSVATPESENFKDSSINMRIIDWRRLDLLGSMSTSGSTVLPAGAAERDGPTGTGGAVGEDHGEEEGPFTPSALSRLAYTLLTRSILPLKPDIILVERQRWRSANSSAILQWTVRVNMLESIIWAILTALRAESERQLELKTMSKSHCRMYEIFGVYPKRVSSFCVPESGKNATQTTGRKLSKSNARKQDKIEQLRAWLMREQPTTVGEQAAGAVEALSQTDALEKGLIPRINFAFSPEAEPVRSAVCATQAAGVGTRVSGALKKAAGLTKLDDVADCFLQAVAWVAWEHNRLQILENEWDVAKGCPKDQQNEGKPTKTSVKKDTVLVEKPPRKEAKSARASAPASRKKQDLVRMEVPSG